MVSFTGKVLSIGKVSEVGPKRARMAEASIADTTGVITLSLWEQFLDKLVPGQIYKCSPVRVRMWAQKKKLSTTFETVVTEAIDADDLESLEVNEHRRGPVKIQVPCLETVEKVETVFHCCNCAKRLLQATAGQLVRCDCCGHSMRTNKCRRTKFAKLSVESDGKVLNLTAFFIT